jgi:hypothetical protein
LGLIVASSPSFADQSHTAFGIGLSSTDAPLGVRVWFARNVALDAAVGLTIRDGGDITDLDFNLGLPLAFVRTEHANLYFVPGAVMGIAGREGRDANHQWTLYGLFEAEYFLSDNFSVSGAHGLRIRIDDPGEGETSSEFDTPGLSWTRFGFHFYFPEG